jgi:arginine decarboxylase
LIVCNGYKDEEFMRLALMGQKLGHRVFIVVEQLSEVDVLLAAANDLSVRPMAGVRIKLSSEGAGRWAQSGGERSKFGLSAAQVMKLIDRLRAADRLDLLKLIHFHIGSQVTDIRYIKSALQEIARYYVEFRRAGVDISYLDVGGGLGVDYDGTSSTSHASVNYSLQEYANDVVYTIAEVCRNHQLPMPHLISESGRALTAHHALLLVKVIDVESQAQPVLPEITRQIPAAAGHDRRLSNARQPGSRRTHAFSRFSTTPSTGARSAVLQQRRALPASARWRRRSTRDGINVHTGAAGSRRLPGIAAELDAVLVDRYFCNFSFQSPPIVGDDQLFPIMPVHRLTNGRIAAARRCDRTDGRSSL